MPEYSLATAGDYPSKIPQFSNLRVLRKTMKNIPGINDTIVSIWVENMLASLTLELICFSKMKGFLKLRSRKTVFYSGEGIGAGNVA